jgi:alkylation response protein AidB-like acyl-CoA dehydrogenase
MKTAGTKMLQAARELAPTIAARGAETETMRRVPGDLLAQLKSAGFFRMFVPRSHGGEELELLSGLEVIETLARADGGTGWTVMLGSETPHLLGLLPRHAFDAVYARGPDVIIGGAFNAQGKAERVDGGYRVTGHWNFASGSQHCDWLFGNCVLLQDGKPLPGPAEGVPATRAVLFPASQARIIDNWSVLGLRGTGSHDYATEAAFVPEERSFDIFMGLPNVPGPTYVAPVVHCVLHMGAVAVGIAQGAVDELITHANAGRKRLYARAPMADSPVFHTHLGRAETTVRAARAALRDVSAQFWAACEQGPQAVPAVMAQVVATTTWVTETTASAVDLCYRLAGGSAVRDGSPLQRRFRDIHTCTQHGAVAEGWYTQLGAAFLGHPVTMSF